MKLYKEFRIDKRFNLHPLFVEPQMIIPIGVWLKATPGPRNAAGKVISKLGGMSFRPGWHLAVTPYAPHIGIRENGKIKYIHDDCVWCECEISEEIDYTELARSMKRKCLDYVPENGFYWFTTNPSAEVEWLIAGMMKVNRILSDGEVAQLCAEKGYVAQPRRRKIA